MRLTATDGEVAWESHDGVWGEAGERAAQKTDNPLRFQGQYLDAETGLHYNRYRYYDPQTAAYISQNPQGLAGGGLNSYQYAPNPLMWVDPLGLLRCGLTSDEVGNASNLTIIKPGSREWKQAVDIIRNNGNSKPNFRVESKTMADALLKESRPKLTEYPEYFGSKNYPKKAGFEHHPNESHTINAPENNMPHIKWSDYSLGKKAPGSGKGHIFYD